MSPRTGDAACLQALLALEGRYTSELLAWIVIALTTLMLWYALTADPPAPGLFTPPPRHVVTTALVNALAAPLIYLCVIGAHSAFIAARVVGSIISGNLRVLEYVAMVLDVETADPGRGLYCGRSHLDVIYDRMRLAITRCGARVITPLTIGLTFPSPQLIASRMITAAFWSGPFVGLAFTKMSAFAYILGPMLVAFAVTLASHYLSDVEVSLRVLSTTLAVPLPSLFLLSPLVYLAVLSALARLKRLCKGVEALRGRAAELERSALRKYVGPPRWLGKLACGLGLDRASLCCLLGYLHYCVAAIDLTAPARVAAVTVVIAVSAIPALT